MQEPRFRVGDMVKTDRLAPKEGWEVVAADGHGSSRTLKLKNRTTKEIASLYEAHCFASLELKMENFRNRRLRIEERANKILSKPLRKK